MLQIEGSPVEYQIGVEAPPSLRTVVNHVLEQDHAEGEVVVQVETDEDQGANQAAQVEEC